MRIDSHHHLWDLATREQPWTTNIPTLRRNFSFDEFGPQLNSADIEASILVQSLSDLEATRDLLKTAAENAAVAGVVGWADLTSDIIGDALNELVDFPGDELLVGLRHPVQDEPDRWLEQPAVVRSLRHLAEAGLTFDLLVQQNQLPDAVRAVKLCPDTRFVLDHLGNPNIADAVDPKWARNMAELSALGNCAVKLSGLVTRSPEIADHLHATYQLYVDVVLETFGPERVMYGSDWPVCLLSAEYKEVHTLAAQLIGHLSAGEQQLIFGEVASQWYSLNSRRRPDSGWGLGEPPSETSIHPSTTRPPKTP